MDAGIPSKVGRYVIDRLIGAGAMGFVYLGRDPELDRPVAIKTIRDLGMDEETLGVFMERFRNEARAAARLHHPSIVQVHDVGDDPDVGPYLVFEYVPGSTLKQIIRNRGALDPHHVLRLAEHVGDAIDLAHSEGIIHRDIKPDNLLVTEDGRTKLADFGVARIPNAALTREGQFLGTPCYAAPETLVEGAYGPASDLFSFTAVLYEAVSGLRAFPGDDAVAVAHKVIHDEPPPASDVARGPEVPPEVDAVLARGLSKDPKQRFGSVEELAGAMRAAYAEAGGVGLDGREPSTSVALGSRARVSTPTTGRRTGNLAFAAVLVGGLAVGTALVFGLSGPSVETDGVEDPEDRGGAGSTEDPSIGAGPGETDTDAGNGVQILNSRLPDAGAASADAGLTAVAALNPHEREEAAKDAVDEAERHLADGDLAAARRALSRARQLDPGNDDIERVESAIAARRGT